MEAEQVETLLMQNNELLYQMAKSLKEIKDVLAKTETDTSTPEEACALLGVNNVRYLTYFHKKGLLKRRKGGLGFLYFKEECKTLAQRIKENPSLLPTTKGIYA